MIKIILLVSGLLFCLNSHSQDDWVLKRDKNDIVIYTRESETSNLKEYRTSALIESPISDVYLFLTDLEYRPAWVVKCTGLEIIDTIERNVIRYQTSYDVPWPLADREMVVEADLSFDEANMEAHLLTTRTDAEYPLKDGVVRISRYREEVFLKELDSQLTRFTAEGFADPGGKVPAWLLNIFLVDGIYNSMIRTREEIAKRKK